MTDPPAEGPADLRSRNVGYYPPSDEERTDAWSKGVVAVDASVLLGLYRYSTATRDELLHLLGALGDRLWLPHQAAVEFERNRIGVIRGQIRTYEDLRTSFDQGLEGLRRELEQVKRHPVLQFTELLRIVDEFDSAVSGHIEAAQEKHPLAASNPDDLLRDPTRSAIEILFRERVGAPPPVDELGDLRKEARRRIEEEIPPGYLDKGKQGSRSEGDFFFWRQAVDRAVALDLPLIVLTDDEKEDWWWREGGLTLGPRPELIAEFFDLSGRRLLMYTTLSFLAAARKRSEGPDLVSATAVGEVERVAAERTLEQVGVECPFCASHQIVGIAPGQGNTALPRCSSCGERFHAFRRTDEEVGVRQPGERVARRRTRVACPECDAAFTVFLPSKGEVLKRVCFSCGTILAIDDQSDCESKGQADRFTVEEGVSRCPRCFRPLYFSYWPPNQERTTCANCDALVTRPGSAVNGDDDTRSDLST